MDASNLARHAAALLGRELAALGSEGVDDTRRHAGLLQIENEGTTPGLRAWDLARAPQVPFDEWQALRAEVARLQEPVSDAERAIARFLAERAYPEWSVRRLELSYAARAAIAESAPSGLILPVPDGALVAALEDLESQLVTLVGTPPTGPAARHYDLLWGARASLYRVESPAAGLALYPRRALIVQPGRALDWLDAYPGERLVVVGGEVPELVGRIPDRWRRLRIHADRGQQVTVYQRELIEHRQRRERS